MALLWGFSNNNVYTGDTGGEIWRFDGNSWNQVYQFPLIGKYYPTIENMWGDSDFDLYAFGVAPDETGLANTSFIAHKIFNMWTILKTDMLTGNVSHLYKNQPDKKIYLQLYKIGGTEFVDSTIIYEYAQEKYIKIYSDVWEKGRQADISYIEGEVYFILGNTIATRVNNQFQNVFTVENPNFYQRIWGRNSKDIFLLMTDGLVHYNGSDFQYLFYFNNSQGTQIFDAAIFEKEVFFIAYESSTNLKLIYHGKLKE